MSVLLEHIFIHAQQPHQLGRSYARHAPGVACADQPSSSDQAVIVPSMRLETEELTIVGPSREKGSLGGGTSISQKNLCRCV